MALLLKHQTPDQLVARVREAWRSRNREELVAIARWILARIGAADITDAQFRAVFGLNVTQWNNKKTQMQTLVNAANVIAGAVGD